MRSSQQPHLASLQGVALSQPLKFAPFALVIPSGQQPYLGEKLMIFTFPFPVSKLCPYSVSVQSSKSSPSSSGQPTNSGPGRGTVAMVTVVSWGCCTCSSVLEIRAAPIERLFALITHENFLERSRVITAQHHVYPGLTSGHSKQPCFFGP